MAKLNETQSNQVRTRILLVIELNPAVSTAKIAKIIGSDYRTVEKYRKEIDDKVMKALQSLEKSEKSGKISIWSSITSLLGGQ